MTETLEKRERRFRLSRELFSQLLKDSQDLSREIREVLEAGVKKCEESIDDSRKTYFICTRSGKRAATEHDIEKYREEKSLFVDSDRGFVYNYGEHITEIEKWPQSLKILACLLKNRGSATLNQILAAIDPDSKITKISNIRIRVSPPVSKLRKILEDKGLILHTLKYISYSLDESIDFVLVSKKVRS